MNKFYCMSVSYTAKCNDWPLNNGGGTDSGFHPPKCQTASKPPILWNDGSTIVRMLNSPVYPTEDNLQFWFSLQSILCQKFPQNMKCVLQFITSWYQIKHQWNNGSPLGPGIYTLKYLLATNKPRVASPKNTTTTKAAIKCDFHLPWYRIGPSILKKLTHTVSVYRIDIAVLMAKICPNFAKSWMAVRHRGIAAIRVVIAELKMETPMWPTANFARAKRISYKGKWK